MRYTLAHPTDTNLSADYGWCPACGYWVELWRRGDCQPWLTYDATDPGCTDTDLLRGALDFLVEHGFLDAGDLERAWLAAPASVGRTAEVMANFREASGE